VAVVSMDFSKAFGKFHPGRLIWKVKSNRIRGELVRWV